MNRFTRTRTCVLALGLMALGLVVGCASDRQVIAQADQMHTSLKPAVIEDPVLANYLQQVGERIITAAGEMDQQHGGPKSHQSEDSAWMFGDKMRFHFVNRSTPILRSSHIAPPLMPDHSGNSMTMRTSSPRCSTASSAGLRTSV